MAQRFKRLCGYDISPTHLAIARQRAYDVAALNINFSQITAADLVERRLEKCDVLYSRLVFQHNPPPVISAMLQASLRALYPDGLAIFQLLIYEADYRFDVAKYLASEKSRHGELHCYPQPDVFRLIAEAGCTVLEVREGSLWGAKREWISNTFVVRQRRVGNS